MQGNAHRAILAPRRIMVRCGACRAGTGSGGVGPGVRWGQRRSGDDMGDKAKAGQLRRVLKVLGRGRITGAADDDPSGIVTFSQAGALALLSAVVRCGGAQRPAGAAARHCPADLEQPQNHAGTHEWPAARCARYPRHIDYGRHGRVAGRRMGSLPPADTRSAPMPAAGPRTKRATAPYKTLNRHCELADAMGSRDSHAVK